MNLYEGWVIVQVGRSGRGARKSLIQSAVSSALPRSMNSVKMPHWLTAIVATMGGGGLFVATFLDSSVLTLPFIADALVVDLSIQRPARMPYYCAMAALGSLAGCIWIYLIAKKGGEAYFQRHRGVDRVKGWVQRNGFLSVFIPGILPPPFPFKVFVIAEGVFQVPLTTFVLALLLGRALRYFVEGILAVRYGNSVLAFLVVHRIGFALGALGGLLALYVVSRLLFRRPPAES
jgi:membrane protein YqaA with SNARE-associated domain